MATLSDSYIQWLSQQQAINYCRVALISMWTFDYFLTLNEEVHLITNKRSWGITHVLYFPTRFCPLVGSLCTIYNALMPTRPQATCVALYRLTEIMLFLGMFASEGLLLIRIMALWSHKRLICRSLMVIYGVVGVTMFVCSIISVCLKFQTFCSETPSSSSALETTLGWVTVGMFWSAAFFELVVLALTLLHGHTLRHSGFRKGKLISAVAQGNMVYTLFIFLTSIASITFFVLPLQDGWDGPLATFQCVLHGIVASRILFDLQCALHNRGDTAAVSMSRLQFATVPKDTMQHIESSA